MSSHIEMNRASSIFTYLLLASIARASTVGTPLRNPQAETKSTLIAVNQGDRDISLIDPAQGTVVARVSEGRVTGHEVATSVDGKLAFVPIYGDSTPGKPGTDGDEVTVIDLSLRRVVHRIRFNHGVRPHCIVMNRHDGLLYVTMEVDQSVSIIDPRTFTIVGTIPTGQAQSHMLAISPDGHFAYTANIAAGSVSVLDLRSRKLIAVIPVARTVQRISVSADGRYVFTADQAEPRLAVIDAATHAVQQWIQLPALGYGSASTLSGRWLIVTLPDASLLAIINTESMRVARTIPVPKEPHEVLIAPDNRAAYVACTAAQIVLQLDLESWQIAKSIKVGTLSDGIGWAQDRVMASRATSEDASEIRGAY